MKTLFWISLFALPRLSSPPDAAAQTLGPEEKYPPRASEAEPPPNVSRALDELQPFPPKLFDRPSRLVGSLAASHTRNVECAAFLVGPRAVLTSQECLRKATFGGFTQMVFKLGHRTEDGVERWLDWSIARLAIMGELPDRWTDGEDASPYPWALLALDEPLGQKYGWFRMPTQRDLLDVGEGRRLSLGSFANRREGRVEPTARRGCAHKGAARRLNGDESRFILRHDCSFLFSVPGGPLWLEATRNEWNPILVGVQIQAPSLWVDPYWSRGLALDPRVVARELEHRTNRLAADGRNKEACELRWKVYPLVPFWPREGLTPPWEETGSRR